VIVGAASAIRDATGRLLLTGENCDRRRDGFPGGPDLERRTLEQID